MIAPIANPTCECDSRIRLEIDQRVNMSIAFKSYLRAQRDYNVAASRFNEACKELRKQLEPNLRVVIHTEDGHFLLESDAACEFDMEEIESI